MKTIPAMTIVLCLGAAFTIVSGAVGQASPAGSEAGAATSGGPTYDSTGRLAFPAGYRDWIFLSAGLDMSYSEAAARSSAHVFDNVFAPPAAVAAFRRTGIWPDKTVLVLEIRSAATNGSINKSGQFQTGAVVALEAHVKDEARFKGGWGFYSFDGDMPATKIPDTAACYSCHLEHAAADTTFVQFYPTLLPLATKFGTLSPSYLKNQIPAGNR